MKENKVKNPYRPFVCLEGFECTEIGTAYWEGQQNPDPTKYAKRVDLLEEMSKCTLSIAEMHRELEGSPKVPVVTLLQANKVIRKHGLKEG